MTTNTEALKAARDALEASKEFVGGIVISRGYGDDLYSKICTALAGLDAALTKPEPENGLKIRCVENYGTHYRVNGKNFLHEPTADEVNAAYADERTKPEPIPGLAEAVIKDGETLPGVSKCLGWVSIPWERLLKLNDAARAQLKMQGK